MKVIAECITETGVDPNVIDQLFKLKYSGDGTDLKCFEKCFLMKIGYMNNDGVIQVEEIDKMYDIPEIRDIIRNCSSSLPRNKNDLCTYSIAYFQCFFNGIKEFKLFNQP